MIRIGKISYWHVHAWDYTNQALQHEDTEIVAVWDEIVERGEASANKLGVPFVANLNEMLARPDIDAVIVDAPTNIHTEVILAAAKAGKHIFTEKVIAPTWREVNEILQQVTESNIKLTVSLPRLNFGYTLAIQDIINQGLLGQVTQVRSRLSHNGATANWLPEHFYNMEQCGGGALIDLGCHPMYLTRMFLGELPTAVSAHFGYMTGREVEDNATAILTTKSGAIGIVEAGFVNDFSPFVIEVQGTKGTILYNDADNKLLFRSSQGSGMWSKEWNELPIPADRHTAFDQWVDHIKQNTIADHNIEMAADLTKLMEAANIAARESRSVQLTELNS
ncbi:Gfo/Idh/MocA family protein [Paenibacillus yanchengensis]|uniref:Gfo/Idh/MocA family protein n=1 Tax=Paenibacillus yanchengensis TaxID=2035833 RepID=A0ABW4YG21_9BACL